MSSTGALRKKVPTSPNAIHDQQDNQAYEVKGNFQSAGQQSQKNTFTAAQYMEVKDGCLFGVMIPEIGSQYQ